jgi:glycosyltransferase involved in cell wall biosynthesis
MIKIDLVRTFYPHWGRHSGIHQFFGYLDREKFRVTEKLVPMSDAFPVPFMKTYFRRIIASMGVREYKLSDLRAEITLLVKNIFFRSDIVFFLDGEHSLLFLPYFFRKFMKEKRRPKIIAMFHQPPHILDTLINKSILQQVDAIVVLSPDAADYLRTFLPVSKVHVVLHGIDTEYFRPAEKKRSDGRFKCLAGGVWLRDYNSLFKTARILLPHKEIEFHVVTSTINVPGDLANVHVHKDISDDDFLSLYQNADVLFMPLEAATANNVLLEGAACGLPIISSDLVSIKTYFPGREAILVGDNNPEEFARAILTLYKDIRGRIRMSLLARKRSEELNLAITARKYEYMAMNIAGK